MPMHIRPAEPADAPLLATLIAAANQGVAARFGITLENCPKHPSFCKAEWLAADFARGERYFILGEGDGDCACVAIEYPSPGLAYLNRLAVLPSHQGRGLGAKLVAHVLQQARERGSVRSVSIGVIAAHMELIHWYRKLGFVSGETKHFPHLPFSVSYMAYELAGEPNAGDASHADA